MLLKTAQQRHSRDHRSPVILFCVAFILALGLTTLTSRESRAADPPLVDTILLKNGGVLYGKAEEVTENKQRLWIVTTTDGTMMKLKRSQVARVQKPSAELQQYLQKKKTMPDNVDAHWAMQKWCLEKHLHRQREFHLIRIVDLDPDHKDARARLGYKDYGGVWVQEEHFNANHGYVKDDRGNDRLPIALEMYDRRQAAEARVTAWNKKIKTWMTRITKRNDREAFKQLTAIKDGDAVPGLMKIYQGTPDLATKQMVIDVLGQIESSRSQNALVVIATTTPDSNFSLAERAVSLLLQPHFNRAGICGTIMHWLRPSPNNKKSGQLDNAKVNRAAWLIGRMEYEPAIRPLIDALNTVHTVPIGGAGGNANVGIGDEGTALDWGKKATHQKHLEQNQVVHDTLRLLVPPGVDFKFDEGAWVDWYVRENSLGTNELGRDK